MWYDELPPGKSWASLWTGYILCGECGGIRPVEGKCPACGSPRYTSDNPSIPFNDQNITAAEDSDVQAEQVSVNGQTIQVRGDTVSGAQIKAAAAAQAMQIQPNSILQEKVSDGT